MPFVSSHLLLCLQGDKHGFVRFGEPEAAEQALKNTDEEGKKAIGKLHATLRLLEGKEEQDFLKKVQFRFSHQSSIKLPCQVVCCFG